MWVHQNIVRVMILIRSLITILSPQRSSLRWTRNDFNLLRPSIFQQTQIYSLQKGKQTQIDWKCKFIKFETHPPSLKLKLWAIPRSFEDSNNKCLSTFSSSHVLMMASVSPLVPEFPVSPVWPVARLPCVPSCARVRTLRSCRAQLSAG